VYRFATIAAIVDSMSSYSASARNPT